MQLSREVASPPRLRIVLLGAALAIAIAGIFHVAVRQRAIDHAIASAPAIEVTSVRQAEKLSEQR